MPDISNPIQRFFWDKLTNGGLDLVDQSRIDKLVDYVTKNEVTSEAASPTDGRQIDSFERGALKELLDSNSWRSLLTDDGVARLEKTLGIQHQEGDALEGQDAVGSVPQGSIDGNFAKALTDGRVTMDKAGQLFAMEMGRRPEISGSQLSEGERAKNALYLFQDYAKVINENASGAEAVEARQGLLKAYFDSPLAKTYGAKDPDGDMLGTAWELAWGTDPERTQGDFDIDKKKKWSAYMSMNGGFVSTAKKIDEVLAAEGKPAKAEAFEKKSPLNWIIREETGNTKPSSSFKESSAIQSTGVDFASKLPVDLQSVGDRKLDSSFDMKVDFYAWNNFVTLDSASGDRLVPKHDESGEELKVEAKLIDDNTWAPVFKNTAGEEVPAKDITNVIVGADGKVKGDGKSTGSYSASWWGFCDRNAMQGLVTLKYGFPQPGRDVTIKSGDNEFTFTKKEVRDMVGRRLTEIFPRHTQAGNRYDDNPDELHLKDGTIVQGKVSTEIDFYHADTHRAGDSMVVIGDRSNAPSGTLGLKLEDGSKEFAVDEVASIRRASQSGVLAGGATKDTIVLKDGTEATGSLLSNVNFSGAKTLADGTLELTNSDDAKITGDLLVKTTRGDEKRVPVSELAYVVREDENEILAEEAMTYIIRNKGVFAADSWTGSSVANGTRTIEEINRWDQTSEDKPSWIPEDVKGLKGYKGDVQDPDNVVFFGMGNKGSTYGGVKFWVELDENRNPINSNVISGQWDFLWGVEGKPDWDAKATFNPNVPNDLVLKLYVNSLEDPSEIADLLPEGWESMVEDQPAPETAPE